MAKNLAPRKVTSQLGKRLLVATALLVLLHAAPAGAATNAAPASLTATDLRRHIEALASDKFEGRAPGTVGEDLTIGYLINAFQAFGLAPGNSDGSYLQKVPLLGITSQPEVVLNIRGKPLELTMPADLIALSLRKQSRVEVNQSEIVFVGYGIQSPEYDWDDFKGVDVKGKTLIMLIGDPPIPDAQAPSRLDPAQFKGKEMTYYGRWTYKYEIAAAKGAAAALIVHETGPAGYPYFVLISSNTRENFALASPNPNEDAVSVQGWLSLSKAMALFTAAGMDYEAMKKKAQSRDFKPVPLGCEATFKINNRLRDVTSYNVAAKLAGAPGAKADEIIVVSAHWDHLGRNEKLEGDQIFNGALDNATGTAGLLELAQAFATSPKSRNRTLLFLAFTAEEKGLLGAKYYVEHPLYPLSNTVANINMDGLNQWGRTRDVEVIGFGQSTLEDDLRRVAQVQGRTIAPDSGPEKGRFFRSDHFEFARHGVPALYLKPGTNYVGKAAGFGEEQSRLYTEQDYHKVTDEIKPGWDLSGAVEDLQLLFGVTLGLAESTSWPAWKAGSEFKKLRPAVR